MSNFFSSLFGGQNDTLSSGIGQYGAISGFGVNKGEGDISAASNFWNSVLSGDTNKIAQVLGPQIKGIQDQGQQQKQTMAQFGNRSGGTNAKAQRIGDDTRTQVNNLVSGVTAGAAGNLAGLGTNLLSQGTSALGAQIDSSQKQMENWSNSLFGKGLTSGFSTLESFGLGKL